MARLQTYPGLLPGISLEVLRAPHVCFHRSRTRVLQMIYFFSKCCEKFQCMRRSSEALSATFVAMHLLCCYSVAAFVD